MDKATVTFRIDPEKKKQLDALTEGLGRDRSYVLNEAVDQYLDLHRWQIGHIQKGVAEAKAGKFVPEAEVEALFRKVRRRRRK